MIASGIKSMLLLVVGMVVLPVFAVGEAPAGDIIDIVTTAQPPVIDGKLDDPVWQTAIKFTGFKTFEPDFGKVPSAGDTVVYVAYDKENFYFGYRCYDKEPGKIKSSMTRRDNIFDEDWVGVILDTNNDKQSGYGFLINPLGVQGDGMMSIEGNFDDSQDMVWYSKGAIDSEGYTAECAIPFQSFRFPGKKKIVMGMCLARQSVRFSETHSFPGLSPDRGTILNQSQLISLSGIKYKRVVEILPAYTYSKKSFHEEGQWQNGKGESDLSLTGKVGLTPQLTLDAAYNPDFSQVEADAGQVDVNLRYDIFYTEKRPFFLEGSEAFQFSGNTEDAPLLSIVHTRRIIDPLFGLKLTGKLSQKTTMAAIYAIDEVPGEDDGQTGNAGFSIFRVRQALNNDSYIGGFYTGREYGGGYNRVVGTDGRFRISPVSVAEFHLFGSMTDQAGNFQRQDGHALGLRYVLSKREMTLDIGLQDVSNNFSTDTGFLTRTGITRLAVFGIYTFFPKSKFFLRLEPFYWSSHIYDKESDMFETANLFTFRVQMRGQSEFRLDMIGANEVYAGQRFNTSGYGFQFVRQLGKKLYLEIFFRRKGGIYYDPDDPYQGKKNQAQVGMEFLASEKLRSSINFNYVDFFRESDGKKIYDYTLLYNRTTFQVNKYLFFRGIAEYNFYRDKLTLDFLTSFTYIPGTVIHLGYGSIFEKIAWQGQEYVPNDRFLETGRGFFFKVSYLWRW